MKIKNVRLKDFKRFSDLTIEGLLSSTKLVVLVGPNGSGKSSVFEGFNALFGVVANSYSVQPDYYFKSGSVLSPGYWSLFEENRINVSFHDYAGIDWNSKKSDDNKVFYIRTGYRYEPEFSLSRLERQGDILEDSNRPKLMTSLDKRVSGNYQRIVAQTVADVYDQSGNDNATRKSIRDKLTGAITSSFKKVIAGATLTGLGDPLEGGTFFFEKGQAKNWPYKNLSAGEKAAFDLISDFIVKREKYDNTVFCIDEPELHMNTSVQGALLEELYSLLPGQSQLWVATHSIGMMKAAQRLETENPGSVVFLDFADKDFDVPVVIQPAVTNKDFWRRNFSVAIGELAELVSPTQIFVCEGDPNGNRKKEFDARCYNKIFASEFPEASFVSVGGSNEVKNKSALLSSVFGQILHGVQVKFIIDRDDSTEHERQEIIAGGDRILSRRHLEAYLLDDEILEKFCSSLSKYALWPALKTAKQQFIAHSVSQRNNPSDDWKSTAEQIRQEAKKLLDITQIGSNADAFMLDYLVPLLPKTAVYSELKQDIFKA